MIRTKLMKFLAMICLVIVIGASLVGWSLFNDLNFVQAQNQAQAQTQVQAQMRVFTAEELLQYNGKDGAKSYTSYQGRVYDVTDSRLWKMGEHFGLQAGIDLTEAMERAPHGAEVFSGFIQIGVLEGFEAEAEAGVDAGKVAADVKTDDADQLVGAAVDPTSARFDSTWYGSRLRLMGITILGWTGILLGVFFVLTFATCFAMPWAQLRLPWTGSRPGPDPLDAAGSHMPWTAIHKHFVWITVILGVVHGLLGLLQLVGIYL
jgi:predicted heme/steroid binding protein